MARSGESRTPVPGRRTVRVEHNRNDGRTIFYTVRRQERPVVDPMFTDLAIDPNDRPYSGRKET